MPVWINLRQHAIDLTYGDRRTVPQGKWIVIRIYRVGEYSEYWDPERKEAYGGEKYNYDDFVVREISKIGQLNKSTAGLLQSMTPVAGIAGYEDPSNKIFAVVQDDRFPRYPNIGDNIFEIEEYEGEDEPVPPLHATGKFKIVNVVHETGDNGQSEVVYMFVQLLEGES
jgi:hypothetical protein